MVNVTLKKSCYHFIDKITGEKFKTYYGWSLYENTAENLELIKKSADIQKRYDVIKKELQEARANIKKLNKKD